MPGLWGTRTSQMAKTLPDIPAHLIWRYPATRTKMYKAIGEDIDEEKKAKYSKT